MSKCAVLGAGSWGTALAVLLARNGNEVSLWGRDDAELADIADRKRNDRYLPGIDVPEGVGVGEDLDADFTVIAVPSDAVREVANRLSEDALVVIAAKGLEMGGKRMSEVVREVKPGARVCVLSGPNLAMEIARGVPTATVIASDDGYAQQVRDAFMCRTFRVYTSNDVIGVELGGALKNVLAIGAGVSDGLGFGDNTKGAFIARGLHEMCALGEALDARRETFMGLSGVGDLFATAVSRLSRNYRVGFALGQGSSLDAAIAEIGQVAEGVPTASAAVGLAERHGVDVPVMQSVNRVLCREITPLEGVSMLMERTARTE
ncbi:MAG: NAD(P)H-dependent glycerol-3-phosphate dehydrogenase [Fimbriimonadales bacterium]